MNIFRSPLVISLNILFIFIYFKFYIAPFLFKIDQLKAALHLHCWTSSNTTHTINWNLKYGSSAMWLMGLNKTKSSCSWYSWWEATAPQNCASRDFRILEHQIIIFVNILKLLCLSLNMKTENNFAKTSSVIERHQF